MRILGLIPSRIGSKRLQAKALLPINGYPLIVRLQTCKSIKNVERRIRLL